MTRIIVFSDEELTAMLKGEAVTDQLFGENYIMVSETGMQNLKNDNNGLIFEHAK